ncbi:sterol desaturase family protein [Coleofasciculus sp. F4-SAH-05]|uniref:sterol desaturase family protein n=1 Tax=Coleofasciculus sp. F4-SAH-05 TaxID=3069525 RepID=UPI0032F43942
MQITNELTNHSFEYYYFVFFGVTLARYFLIAGGAYWLFYVILEKFLAKNSLRLKPLKNDSIRHDILLSVLSAIVFAFCAALILSEYGLGVTLLYTNPYDYGLWYLGVSFVAVLILQDTYFYFIHRLFHHPWLFKWMHSGHHRSGEPTPWSSFAFDLPEAIIQSLFFVVIIFIVPLHFITLAAALITMTIWAVVSHLGFELFPSSFLHHWLGKWFIGATYHSIHHRQYTVHYGLYFTFWDKLLGT